MSDKSQVSQDDNKTVKTTCPYCGVGCGVIVTREQGTYKVRGNPDHPSNMGRLCSKGAALADTLDDEGRMLFPQVNGMQSNWGEALQLVATHFQSCIDEYGRDSVACMYPVNYLQKTIM